MITRTLDIIINNDLYKQNKCIEVAKGFYNKGGFIKRLKRNIRLWL